ncbi:hypothetical protein JR316_0007438 [Psilocybe cubensis]|uniref:Uncharacterized protein n=2 Tax=Psilocybe cubensis TaxID=181762 RepID=A0ACB8H026_PSICU|nr:hypothetical protein JR316_0007438 [Psilocybe cubensis]KAH9480836.1 hypothetical protein JR316_0007438 [Psilocybe cubensis]
MQPQTLPPELWDSIFSFLYDDRPASLRSCAGVNKQFSELVEKYLYRKVTITNHGGLRAYPEAYSAEQMAKLLQNKPHISSYVRSLNIETYIFDTSIRIRSEKVLGHTISLFPKLTEISLSGCHHIMASWIIFHGEFQKSFAHILRLPTLETLTIQDMRQFPLHLLDYCTSLKTLRLLRVQAAMLGLHSPLALPSPPAQGLSNLLTLELSKGVGADLGPLIFWFISPKTPSTISLKALHIHLTHLYDAPLIQLLLNSKPADSVKSLYMNVNSQVRTVFHANAYNELHRTSSPSNEQIWDLSSLTSLQTIEISASIDFARVVSRYGSTILNASYVLYSPIPWITRLLEKPSLPLIQLRSVVIVLTLPLSIDAVLLLGKMDWKPLTDIIWLLARRYSLRSVEIRLMTSSHQHFHGETVTHDVQEILTMLEDNQHLEMLIRKGILKLNSSELAITFPSN